jgi:hypothetical protein
VKVSGIPGTVSSGRTKSGRVDKRVKRDGHRACRLREQKLHSKYAGMYADAVNSGEVSYKSAYELESHLRQFLLSWIQKNVANWRMTGVAEDLLAERSAFERKKRGDAP